MMRPRHVAKQHGRLVIAADLDRQAGNRAGMAGRSSPGEAECLDRRPAPYCQIERCIICQRKLISAFSKNRP